MLRPPKWLWLLDITVAITFVSGVASFIAWRRSENFRKSTFSSVPRAEDIIGGQLRGTRLKRKDYKKWFPEEDDEH
uniref:Transmembrane protein n=1 Tax=Setaria digitata TaxID=48799 RepID=A0A915Q844_9BILA